MLIVKSQDKRMIVIFESATIIRPDKCIEEDETKYKVLVNGKYFGEYKSWYGATMAVNGIIDGCYIKKPYYQMPEDNYLEPENAYAEEP